MTSAVAGIRSRPREFSTMSSENRTPENPSAVCRLLAVFDRETVFRSLVLLVALGVLVWLLHERFYQPWYEEKLRTAAAEELAEAKERFSAEIWSLDPEDHLREPVPDVENVAHWAVAGGAAVVDDGAFGELLDAIARAAPADSREEAEVSVDRLGPGLAWNQPALSLLRRMHGLERSTYGLDYGRLGEMVLPDPAELHHAAALLHLDARDAAAAGEVERLTRDLGALDVFAVSLRRESSWELQKVAANVERLLLASVRRALVAGVDPDLLAPFVAEDPSTDLCERSGRTLAWEAASDLLVRPGGMRLGAMQRSLDDPWERKHFLARYDHHAATLLDLLAKRSLLCDHEDPFWDLLAAYGAKSRTFPSPVPQHWLELAPAGLAELGLRRAAHRRLGRVALDVRRKGLDVGQYPDDLSTFREAGTDRYFGLGLVLRPLDDGGVELALRTEGVEERRLRAAPAPWRLPPL